MLNIDIDMIDNCDIKYVHALVLTLKHFNFMSSYISLFKDDDFYFVYGFGIFQYFENINQAINFLFNVFSDDIKQLEKMNQFYSRILSVGFSNSDAMDYLNFYSDYQKKLIRK